MIISGVGRKSWKVRLAIWAVYFLLAVGGVTMVVPFMIMLTGSVSNGLDVERYDVFPQYFFDETDRYEKFLAEKYTVTYFNNFAGSYGLEEQYMAFREVGLDKQLTPRLEEIYNRRHQLPQLRAVAEDFWAFVRMCDVRDLMPMMYRQTNREWQSFLRTKYEKQYLQRTGLKAENVSARDLHKGSIAELGRAWNDWACEYWDQQDVKSLMNPEVLGRRWFPDDDQRSLDFYEFLSGLDPRHRFPVGVKIPWTNFLWGEGVTAEVYNQHMGTRLTSIRQALFPTRRPQDPWLAEKFDKFLAKSWSMRQSVLEESARPLWQAFLKERFGDAAAFNRACGANYVSLSDVPFYATVPDTELLRNVWMDFVPTLQGGHLRPRTVEEDYRNFVRNRYHDIAAVNAAYGWNLKSFDEADLPIPEADLYEYLTTRRGALWGFLTDNFRDVYQYIAQRGRALPNTIILVGLTLVFALTVNPLAAYALSRFRLKWTQAILIYLLATMSFPPDVSLIPSFLLLRDMHLMNTYWALLLPGVANGFNIFLLKGFFDSLPKELYEAAELDGASEIRIFWTITMSLSKPILSVIALGSFLAAYGGFMWAFLVCQNPNMWTLMVWLFQFQIEQGNAQHLVMASLVVSSIPTLLVFLFCQKIILRGIVLPVMK